MFYGKDIHLKRKRNAGYNQNPAVKKMIDD